MEWCAGMEVDEGEIQIGNGEEQRRSAGEEHDAILFRLYMQEGFLTAIKWERYSVTARNPYLETFIKVPVG